MPTSFFQLSLSKDWIPMLCVALSLPTPQRWHLFCPATCQTLVTSRILKNGGKFVTWRPNTCFGVQYHIVDIGYKVLKLRVQGWSIEWVLVCVNSDYWMPLAASGEFIQPRSFALSLHMYRATHQVVLQVLLTSKKKLHFSARRIYRAHVQDAPQEMEGN